MLSNRMMGSILLVVTAAVMADSGLARDLYVDNVTGRDDFSGEGREPGDGVHGPFFTIRRALHAFHPGDSLTLINTGVPYYESLSLVGPRFSGNATGAVVINGNGAVLSGARPVPPEIWQYAGNDLWRFRPYRKGWYQLLLNGTPLPEVRVDRSAAALPELSAGEWCAWNSLFWYRAKLGAGERPPELPIEFAYDSVGISLIDVHHVVIRDLTVRHFRQDGINAHDGADTIILDRVNLLENGRAGLSVSGKSLVGLRDGTVRGNREVQVINAEVAQTELENVDFGTVAHPFRLRGGHLIRDGIEVIEE